MIKNKAPYLPEIMQKEILVVLAKQNFENRDILGLVSNLERIEEDSLDEKVKETTNEIQNLLVQLITK